MVSKSELTDYPKLHPPYKREMNSNGHYVVTDEIKPDYEWVFSDPQVKAVEKLDGINASIVVDSSQNISHISTRLGPEKVNKVSLSDPTHPYILSAFLNSQSYDLLDQVEPNKQNFGEIIGPKVQGNPYNLDEHLFIPFEYLYTNLYYSEWESSPKNFEFIRDWFKDLHSLLYSQPNGLSPRSLSEKIPAEGVVFTHPDGRKAKLRREMFEWYRTQKMQTESEN